MKLKRWHPIQIMPLGNEAGTFLIVFQLGFWGTLEPLGSGTPLIIPLPLPPSVNSLRRTQPEDNYMSRPLPKSERH